MKKVLLLIVFVIHSYGSYGQASNPFDIIRSTQDTVVTKRVTIEETGTKLSGDNPFTVSHIPIRKNQLQEIEKLTMTNKVAEEDISLFSLPLWILMGSLCLLAFVLFNKKDHLTILIRSLASENFMRMTNYEEKGGFSLIYMLGYGLYIFNFSLFIFLILTRLFKIRENSDHALFSDWRFFGTILLASCAFFLGKHLVNTFFSWVFHLSKESKLYDFTIISIYNLLGICFLLLNILILFGPSAWLKGLAIIGVLLFIIFLLSRHYKGVRIGVHQLNNYFFHFFLYFCAFEISPWVVVYTFIKDFI